MKKTSASMCKLIIGTLVHELYRTRDAQSYTYKLDSESMRKYLGLDEGGSVRFSIHFVEPKHARHHSVRSVATR